MEKNVIDTHLQSQYIGTAIGAAMMGKRPIAEIQFADFILPATNQIISEAAKMRYRSNNDWGCPITIRAPFVEVFMVVCITHKVLKAFSLQPQD